jgi:hypothetical protein
MLMGWVQYHWIWVEDVAVPEELVGASVKFPAVVALAPAEAALQLAAGQEAPESSACTTRE